MEQKPQFVSSAYQMLTSILSSTVQKSRDDPRKVVGASGAVRGTADYREDYWTAIVWRHREFCYQTQTENIQALRASSSGECIVRMHSCRVVTTRHWPRYLAHAHLSISQQRSPPGLWTVYGVMCVCVCVCVCVCGQARTFWGYMKIIPWEYRPVARPQPTHDNTTQSYLKPQRSTYWAV